MKHKCAQCQLLVLPCAEISARPWMCVPPTPKMCSSTLCAAGTAQPSCAPFLASAHVTHVHLFCVLCAGDTQALSAELLSQRCVLQFLCRVPPHHFSLTCALVLVHFNHRSFQPKQAGLPLPILLQNAEQPLQCQGLVCFFHSPRSEGLAIRLICLD